MKKLKERWGLTSNLQLIIILIVFAITGSTSAYIAKPILSYLGIHKTDMHILLYVILYILIIFPIYKIMLLVIGTLFGQHHFFKNFLVKMLSRMGFAFLFKKNIK
jgi:manganese efflux pump family protein